MNDVQEKTTKALRAVVIINNDRYEGYKRAADETKDGDLKAIFTRFSLQSKDFSEKLQSLIPDLRDVPNDDATKASGKLYRVWMDIKAALAKNDRKAILASCEFGEDEALRTYDNVLENPKDISSEVLGIIREQRSEIHKGHDTVKAMRDRN